MRANEALQRQLGRPGTDAASRGTEQPLSPRNMAIHRASFGRYVLLRRLATGGMGEIFLAKERGAAGHERLVVIKRILSHHLDKEDYVKMFFEEAALVKRLHHPNIVEIFDMGQIEGDHFIAMEYVRGKSVRDLVDVLRARGRTLEPGHAVELGIELCEGLGYAHQARDASGRPMNIVHRDINPHNILLTYGGALKLIDFGIAKSEMTSVQTATGTIKGKFVYMSPEQSAADPLDRRSDIFSLGIVLYELLALENPFVRQNVVLSLEAIQRQPVPPIGDRRPELAGLDAILAKALAKDPAARYQTATEMRDDLRTLQRSEAIPLARTRLDVVLEELFAPEIQEEARLLAEAERRARAMPPPIPAVLASDETDELLASSRGPAPQPGAFSDEEPTVAGDPGQMALVSRSGSPEPYVFDQLPSDRGSAIAVGGVVEAGASVMTPPRGLRPSEPPASMSGSPWLWMAIKYALLFVLTMAGGFVATRSVVGDGTSEAPIAADGPEDRVEPPPLVAPDPIEPEPEEAPTPAAVLPTPKQPKLEPKPKPKRARRRPEPARRRPERASKPRPEPRPEPTQPKQADPEPTRPEPVLAAVAPAPSEPEPPAVVLGRLGIEVTHQMSIVANGKRLGGSKAGVSLRRSEGRIVLSGGRGDVDYVVTLAYRITAEGLTLEAEASPWAILKNDGIAVGRTPRTVRAERNFRLSFIRPGQRTPLIVGIRWKPE